MKSIAILKNSTALTRMSTLIFLWLFFTLITIAFIRVFGYLTWDVDLLSIGAEPDFENGEHVAYLRFIQIANQIGSLMIPPIVLALFVSQKPLQWLTLDKGPKSSSILLALLLSMAIYPFIDLLSAWNMGMKFPEGLSGITRFMQEAEDSATQLTEAFLLNDRLDNFLSNLVMVGLLAAFCEDLLFRPTLIRIFGQWFKNAHLAVLVSAFLFAASHLQFFTFLPRFVLGTILGYLFIWSRTVWLPFAFHFVYNSGAVVAYYLYSKGAIDVEPDMLTAGPGTWFYGLSIVLTVGIVVLLRRNELRVAGEKDWMIEEL